MSWALAALSLLLVAAGLRLRRRLAALAVLEPSAREVDEGHRFLVLRGVELDEDVRRAASAHARERGLEVLDLVPADLAAHRAMAFGELVDPSTYETDRLAPGRTAGCAMLVTADVAERVGPRALEALERGVADAVEMTELALELKRCASRTFGFAIAPGLRAPPEDPGRRRRLLTALMGRGTTFVLAAQGLFHLLLVTSVVWWPPWGAVLLGTFHAQPLLALGGGRVGRRGLLTFALLRLPIEAVVWARTLAQPRVPLVDPVEVERRRPEYARELEAGVERFFEPRREDCPLCGSKRLSVRVRTRDVFLGKPGRFTLEHCRDCGHVFQNPRLTLEGLGFYYRDFYDGLGADYIDMVFACSRDRYEDRARMVEGHAEPRRWLDVGGGHGHFCAIARDVWPRARFEILDFSDAPEHAVRRGWCDGGHRGELLERASELEGRFDVVSMSHYLEHTTAPWDEVAAARRILEPGGLLLIELPDPECPIGRLLGRLWLPWFQPQHLHLLSRRNLERILRREGFEPLVWHRAEAYQRQDFMFAALIGLDLVAEPERPWLPPSTTARRWWRGVRWTLGVPIVFLGWLVDLALVPLVGPLGLSNTYRVLARRTEEVSGDGSGS